jgi:lipid II isoglutaminyl synthase (glutamine-hydrolysing)
MIIRIAHLYYDLMNLYGENANIRALQMFFERQNVNVKIDYLTVGDEINFKKYDIFYMGMGSEKSQLIALNDLMKRKNEVKKAIEDNKYFFLTGNSYELLGKYIIDFDGNKIETLNIFNFYTKIITIKDMNNAATFRIVGETSGNTKLIKEKVIGFQNKSGTIYNNDSPFLNITYGIGDRPNECNEGYVYNNLYATHLIGPLFIRNPYLTNYFVKKIIKEKDKNFKYKDITNTIEFKAYKKYLENFPNI